MAPGSQAVGYSSLSPKEVRPITLIQIQRAVQFPSSQNALSTKGNTGPARGRPGNQVINNHHGSGGRQRRSTDGASQVRYAPAMTADICTWLPDEEARGSPNGACHSAILACPLRVPVPVPVPVPVRVSSPTSLPNLAIFDQGGSAALRRGPAQPRRALPWARPAHAGPARAHPPIHQLIASTPQDAMHLHAL